MLSKLILQIMIAFFSVFGFCSALQTVLDIVFTSKHYWITVKVRDEKDADMLDMLLHEAASAFFKKRGTRTVVLISSSLFQNGTVGSADGILYDRYAELIEEYEAECYVMEWE